MERIALVILGRHGDIVNSLPLAKKWHDDGNEVTIICADAYAAILDAASYVKTVIHDNFNQNDFDGAIKRAVSMGFDRVICCRAQPGEILQTTSWQTRQWERMGHPELFHDLPLVFDKRDAKGEAEAVRLHVPPEDGRPLLATCFSGNGGSSPYFQARQQTRWVNEAFGKDYRIVHLADINARRVHFLIGILEKCEVLITSDTLPLHLAYATMTPTIAMSTGLIGSPATSEPRQHWVYHCSYPDSVTESCREEIKRIINEKDYATGRLVRKIETSPTPTTNRVRGGDPHEITVKVIAGLGDIFWVYQKLTPLFEAINFDILACSKGEVDCRSLRWMKVLPKVVSAKMEVVSPSQYSALALSRTRLADALKLPVKAYSANRWLELGTRLEDIDPEMPVEWDVPLLSQPSGLPFDRYLCLAVAAATLEERVQRDPKRRIWSIDGWKLFLDLFWEKYQPDTPIVVLGANFDRQVCELLHAHLLNKGIESHLFVGHPPLKVVDVLRKTDFLLGYQSGLGILADNMDTPCLNVVFSEYAPQCYSWCKMENIHKTFFSPVFDIGPQGVIDYLPDQLPLPPMRANSIPD